MNRDNATMILHIDNFDEYDYEKLKKQFKKQSLKKHPDKGGSHEDFIELSTAYDFLKNELDNDNKEDDIFTLFTKIILTRNTNRKEQENIKEQILKFINTISGKLLNNVDKDNLIFLKQIIDKYSYFFDKEVYDELIKTINEKTDNIKLYNLTPSVNDLFLDNIFNLNLNNDTTNDTMLSLLIPLWHNELIYDISGETIIVQIAPELPDNCNIDINNNIHYYFSRKLDSSLLDKEELTFEINNKTYKVKTTKIFIKKNQTFIFKESGISRISNSDIFDNNDKSDLIINFTLY
jgi:curved DNA-binding protein CbpA